MPLDDDSQLGMDRKIITLTLFSPARTLSLKPETERHGRTRCDEIGLVRRGLFKLIDHDYIQRLSLRH